MTGVSSSAGDESPTLQSRMEVADPAGRDNRAAPHAVAEPTISDAAALFRQLDVSGRFHRDGRLGRLYHRGMVSLRENVSTNSLHISVDDNQVAAHVDRVSPLALESKRASAYSLRQALAHNVAGMAQDLMWLMRGRQGDHRCELNCEWVSGEAQSTPAEADLLDPTASRWSVQLEARVAGPLDEARLRAALGVILGGCTLERDPLDVVDCLDDEALDAARTRLQSMVVPVGGCAPLHVYLARHPAGDVLMLNLNHAASDGFAALRVLQSIARAYAGDPVGALDFLAVRDLPVRPASVHTSVLERSYKRVVERLRNMLDRPARVAADQPVDHPGYGFHLVGLSAQETRHVVDVERPRNSTNVLMAALHLAIGQWNLQHGTPARRIGVLVHADLRPAGWREDTIGNFSVTARMSSTRGERAGPAVALDVMTAQIARNKRTRTGVALIAALERSGLLALWAKQSIVVLQPLTGNHMVDTTVLCNLGSPDETPCFGPDVGEVVELWCSTPARAPLSLCLGAVTVAGRLHLTFRYPHRLFGPDAARRFAECYLRHLRLVADCATP
ncbi:MAG: hypothetical protein QOK16_495 [Solirubrobacteraceae bacterium]|nr:hypothetical protein [Solirubrobacteraceae bacterium]